MPHMWNLSLSPSLTEMCGMMWRKDGCLRKVLQLLQTFHFHMKKPIRLCQPLTDGNSNQLCRVTPHLCTIKDFGYLSCRGCILIRLQLHLPSCSCGFPASQLTQTWESAYFLHFKEIMTKTKKSNQTPQTKHTLDTRPNPYKTYTKGNAFHVEVQED